MASRFPKMNIASFLLPGEAANAEAILNSGNCIVTTIRPYASCPDTSVMLYIEYDQLVENITENDLQMNDKKRRVQCFNLNWGNNLGNVDRILNDPECNIIHKKEFPCAKGSFILLYMYWEEPFATDDVEPF